jgi:predicted membrane channel-forming protein YqfA (hemolysin III family)
MFMLHNETVNVWTHFFGFLMFLGMVFYVIVWMAPASYDKDLSLMQRWTNLPSGQIDFCPTVIEHFNANV